MHAPDTLPQSASALGVSFDGRAWHYRQYSYDRLVDALAYARLDTGRSGMRQDTAAYRWQHWDAPTEQDRSRMAAHGIVYEHGYFYYGPYRYEVLDAALAYAKHEPGLPRGGRTAPAEGT